MSAIATAVPSRSPIKDPQLRLIPYLRDTLDGPLYEELQGHAHLPFLHALLGFDPAGAAVFDAIDAAEEPTA